MRDGGRCWRHRAGDFAHAYLPAMNGARSRTESVSIVVYDSWTGRMQRAVYDDKGGLNVMGVYTPF